MQNTEPIPLPHGKPRRGEQTNKQTNKQCPTCSRLALRSLAVVGIPAHPELRDTTPLVMRASSSTCSLLCIFVVALFVRPDCAHLQNASRSYAMEHLRLRELSELSETLCCCC
jgi:hypothetical protein